MKIIIQNILFLFPGRDRLKLLILLVAIIVTAIFEVAGVASIMPFMALIASPDAVMQNPMFTRLGSWVGANDTTSMQFAAGVLTLVLLFLSNMSALVCHWLLLKFSHSRGHVVSSRLLAHYLAQPYEFFLNHHTAELSKNILNEVQRMTGAVIIPVLQLVARSIVALCMIGLLLALYPGMTLVVATAIGLLYATIYLIIRRKLAVNGRGVMEAESKKFTTVSEAFGGVKDVLLTGRQAFFTQRFNTASKRHSRYTAVAEAWSLLPKYALELMAFGCIVIMAMYLLRHSSTEAVMPVLAIYAFAGYRLMPAMQQIYGNLVLIRYHGAALNNIVRELRELPMPLTQTTEPLTFNAPLQLQHVSYAYPRTETTLQDINLTITPRTTIGFAGMSGAGKTTLVDIILGLLPLTSGQMKIGETSLTTANRRSWQSLLGYVPQSIYLTDDTIASNVAFGLPPEEIDTAKLERAAERAHLHEFIMTLPQGYQSLVGERGIRLSGGQRQRIGIARALYREPALLILDEATSALDNLTENAVMEAINEMSGTLTMLIIAHRLSTLKCCDRIILMEAGRIVDEGTYEELMKHSEPFKKMANAKDGIV